MQSRVPLGLDKYSSLHGEIPNVINTVFVLFFSSMIYGFVKLKGIEKFDYVESLSFGALISATDPGTLSYFKYFIRPFIVSTVS